jgi:hypothetical protein
MKKLSKIDMKKLKGGDEEVNCIRKCREAYQLCLQLGGDPGYCTTYRQRCIYKCLGCNPICP